MTWLIGIGALALVAEIIREDWKEFGKQGELLPKEETTNGKR